MFIEFENGGDIAASVAIIGRGPDRQHGLVEVPLVPFHDELMGSTDHVDVVGGVELRHDVAAEQISGAARRHAPALRVLGIGPEQVAHGSVVRHFLLPVYGPDLIERLNGRREAAVNAEDLAVDDGREREIVEDFRAVAPDGDGAVFAQALVVEAVDLSDLTRLVVAPNQHDAVRVADFEREEQEERLDAVEAAIDEITQKQIVRLRNVAADLEQLLQVVELPVDVA